MAERAPYVALWDRAPWQGLVPLAVMLPVCLILARPNPLSIGGARNDKFDPKRPGIVCWSRHPLLLALVLWAAAHVVPNGDLADVILFGTFAAYALIGGHLIDRRRSREMGMEWQRLRVAVAGLPRASSSVSGSVLRRLASGIAHYATLLSAHPILLGVSPLP